MIKKVTELKRGDKFKYRGDEYSVLNNSGEYKNKYKESLCDLIVCKNKNSKSIKFCSFSYMSYELITTL